MRSTIEMAREASVVPYIVGPTNTEYLERIERLVELARADERKIVMNEPLTKEMWQRFEDEIRADEREACAEVCDDRGIKFFSDSPFAVECHGLAEQIRARGETK